MELDTTLIVDPDPSGPVLEDVRKPGRWYPIEIAILVDRYRSLGAEELSRNWIPEHDCAQINEKARELQL